MIANLFRALFPWRLAGCGPSADPLSVFRDFAEGLRRLVARG